MKLYKSLLAASALGALVLTGCRDDFAETNENKTAVVKAEPSYLMAQAVIDFEASDYLLWFYNTKMYGQWSQMLTPTGSFTAQYTEMTATGGQGSQYIKTLRYRNELKNLVETREAGATYKAYVSVCDVLSIYLAIFDSDIYGDIPYTEAAMAKFDGPLTPKYDRIADLYNLWLTDLDAAIANFQDPTQELTVARSGEDAIYGGDMAKWAKLANSLKLKIAARLISQNRTKALEIAQQVASAACGYLDNVDEDMIFAKGTVVTSGDGDKVYHFGNDIQPLAATQQVVDYLMASKDPRVRFFYTKDGFNSKVVQGFIDAGTFNQLPTYVKNNVVLDAQGNFKEWGGMGEPWVRYAGLPVVYDKANDAAYKEYFNPGTDYNLKIDDATKSYAHYSTLNEEMVRGRVDFTVPTLPGKTIQDTKDVPWYGMYLTSAETNLYLAEFKLLGANLPQSAEYYYDRGVRFSVQAYDKVAGLNDIPYYSSTYNYDEKEATINLKEGELDAMMATPAVKLTGTPAEQLEKVYVQQLLHFTMLPDDQFTTARRSGCPKVGSSLIAFQEFSDVKTAAIPRRFSVTDPSKTDQMYSILIEAYKTQGFTTGSNQSGGAYNGNSTVLNTERLWFDQGAPQWGEGPKM